MNNHKISVTAIALVALALIGSVPSGSTTYAIDTQHTQIQFRVRHLGISTVTGHFAAFGGNLVFDPNAMEDGSVDVAIEAASIDTAVEARDEHLRSADFFDVAEHPEMTFKSSAVEMTDDGLKVNGDLTIRGVTRPVVLDAEFNGSAVDPWGNSRVGFSARTKISRQDFGLTWNKALEAGGFVVGDEVSIILDIEAIEQKAEAAGAQ
jgi:polyisoprenoid-binding protein YceI